MLCLSVPPLPRYVSLYPSLSHITSCCDLSRSHSRSSQVSSWIGDNKGNLGVVGSGVTVTSESIQNECPRRTSGDAVLLDSPAFADGKNLRPFNVGVKEHMALFSKGRDVTPVAWSNSSEVTVCQPRCQCCLFQI